MTCSLLRYADTPDVCAACGTILTDGQLRWCSADCRRFYDRNHYWPNARAAALQRDEFSCIKCHFTGDDDYVLYTRARLLKGHEDNWLEVNHIAPRVGQGYGMGCHNHQSNLETLCHACHVKVTRRQRVQRARLLAS
jgi:5-methylcytosine-specific restriction endonuclease McrA